MNDERAVAAAIHAGLQSDEVTDLYTATAGAAASAARASCP